MKYDVFISYSRNDYVKNKVIIPNNVISAIKEKLRQNNISYWMDEEGNLTGKEFASIIAEKIRESMVFLFVCSYNSVASKWVHRELSVADTLNKHIIPLVCDDSYLNDKVIMFTTSLDRIEYFTNPEKGLEELISTIEKDKIEEGKTHYFFINSGLHDLTEPIRHTVYKHYFPIEDVTNDSTETFFRKTKACLEEMYAFHKSLCYEPDKGREDYLLAEWIINNSRIKDSLLQSLVQTYHESPTNSLAHAVYDYRVGTKWGDD